MKGLGSDKKLSRSFPRPTQKDHFNYQALSGSNSNWNYFISYMIINSRRYNEIFIYICIQNIFTYNVGVRYGDLG